MYPIYQVHSKERVPCEGIFILPIEAVNVTRLRRHQDTDRTSLSQVISCGLHKIARPVTQLLG